MNGQEPSHLNSLDIARGIAAFAVVLFHWNALFLVGSEFPEFYLPARQPAYAFLRVFYEHGHAAVSLFFTLSGFIFFRFFARRIASGTLRLSEFFVQRVSRLYPLHLATLLIVAAGQAVYHAQRAQFYGTASNTTQDFVFSLFMLPSSNDGTGLSFNGPSWTVSVEMFLYAMFFVYCITARPRLPVMAAIVLIGFLILGPVRPALGVGVGSFFLGGCMAIVCEYVSRSARRKYLVMAIILASLLLWIAAILLPIRQVGAICIVAPLGGGVDLLTTVLFPLTILALALWEGEKPAAFCRFANATRLGPLSYSVYLLHFPFQLGIVVVTGFFGISSDVFYSPVVLAAFIVALVTLGLLSHYSFEMPIQRMIRSVFVEKSAS